MEVPKNFFKNRIPHDPAMSPLGIYLKEMKSLSQRYLLMFITELFRIANSQDRGNNLSPKW